MFWNIFLQSLALIVVFVLAGQLIARQLTARGQEKDSG